MRRIAAAVLLLSWVSCLPGWAREKKLPGGEGSDDSVSLVATAFDADQLKQTFGSDFAGNYVVVEVTLTPKGGKPLDVHLDDFLLRSEQTGDHSGPLVASQIAGSSSLVVSHTEQKGKGGGGGFGGFGGIMMGGGGGSAPAPPEASKVEMKEGGKKDPMLDVLKRKILAEKTIGEPVTGLLFFPLEKDKTKNLNLTYTTPSGKIRLKFR